MLCLCKPSQKSPGGCLCQSSQRHSWLCWSWSTLLVNLEVCLVTFWKKLCPRAVSDIPGKSWAVAGSILVVKTLWAVQHKSQQGSSGQGLCQSLEDSRWDLRTILVPAVYCREVISPKASSFSGEITGSLSDRCALRSSQEFRNSRRFCNPVIGGRSIGALMFPALVRLQSQGQNSVVHPPRVPPEKVQRSMPVFFLNLSFNFPQFY